MSKLSAAALVVALIAVVHSVWLQSTIDRRIAEGTAVALRERESKLVQGLAPKVRLIYHDFAGDETKLTDAEKNPRTLEELIGPLVRIIQSTTGK